MRIGVFDSGIGGEAVASKLADSFPDADILTASDKEHVPYGNRSAQEILDLTDAAIQPLLASKCDIIVIACNTATAVAISMLRERYPKQSFIGLEPMLKPAATQTSTGVIAVCATPATLTSPHYLDAKQRHAASTRVVEPDCSEWARLIEANEMNRARIDAMVNECLAANADVIVLGCTHYHWIEEEIREAANGRAIILEPSEAIARRISELLKL